MLAGHEELSVIALGVQRISGDKGTGKVKAFQERLELRDLVGGAGNVTLGEHYTVVVVQCCQQVHCRTVVGCRAAQALAVDRQDAALSPAWWMELVGEPCAHRGIQPVSIDTPKHPAEGCLVGPWRMPVSGSRRTPSAARIGWG
jgi:hypothetical protein